jgi:uncharacterized SAM-binding protein YcdF (DUF218 family)
VTTRLVVVLGYSDGGGAHLHPVCAARLALMRAAWRGAAREVVVDPDARTTVQNLANALNDVLRVDANEVVVVTSSWHARRATAAMRWFLRRRDVAVRAESPPGQSARAALRELALWPLLPFQLWQAGRAR